MTRLTDEAPAAAAGVASGASAYLTKTFLPRQRIEAVNRLCPRRPADRARPGTAQLADTLSGSCASGPSGLAALAGFRVLTLGGGRLTPELG